MVRAQDNITNYALVINNSIDDNRIIKDNNYNFGLPH